jgi:N-acetylglutamate synthase-like GNAT family acetyltransferase
MIRTATERDIPEIHAMLREYRLASPLKAHADIDETTAKQMVDVVIKQDRGLILISEHKDKIRGMLLAIYSFNMWDQKIRCMNELAWWVRPEYRGSTDGYRMLMKYKEVGDLLIERKEIKYYTISKMVTSPDLKYDRFGFDKLEEMYICQPH